MTIISAEKDFTVKIFYSRRVYDSILSNLLHRHFIGSADRANDRAGVSGGVRRVSQGERHRALRGGAGGRDGWRARWTRRRRRGRRGRNGRRVESTLGAATRRAAAEALLARRRAARDCDQSARRAARDCARGRRVGCTATDAAARQHGAQRAGCAIRAAQHRRPVPRR